MRLKISHKTVYSYDRPVHYALQQLRLTPRESIGQKVLSWSLEVSGANRELSFEDQFRNHVDLLSMQESQKVEIISQGEVEIEDRTGVIGKGRSITPLWLFQQKTDATAPGATIRRLVRDLGKTVEEDQLQAMHDLCAAVGEAVAYTKGSTGVATSAEEALTAAQGVCQDQAHVMIAAARLMGRPARYVSGYLMMDGATDQEASHAWCEVWVDGLGWVGFDVANEVCPDDRYVRVAIGRDYSEAAPVHGLRQGVAEEELCVSLQVQQ
ncbi:transglutaminase family protein [Pseudooceanicola sp.]|uniref:transglutaminase family protein n=1 Tax=Pseudooceanicola sp. TaxID=1914328 RepID=UPI00261B3FB5|nr:transglutaminase family protein [Pseudooceanicola sp.]MDF1854646.1 transglutaminase family protein [Pseudooceanicola sp.]